MPIVMSKEELARIQRWTETNREDPDVVRRRELVRYLDTTSQAMTKSWPNSLENMNKRNEELRLARIAVAEQANSQFYKRYVKRQREQQQRLMNSARDTVFKNKDAPKLLLSAVIETCVQKERIEQLKFINERRREAAEQKRKDDDDIVRKAKEWEELMANKRKLRFETNKKHQKEILEQANEIAEKNRLEFENELNMQKIDNMQADQQMQALKEFEENFKAAEKARIFTDMEQTKREVRQRKNEQDARDKMDDKLLTVLQRSQARKDKKRKETENQLKAQKLAILENISKKLASGDAAREAKERAIMDKAISEKEAIMKARHEAQLKKEAGFRQQRHQLREQWLRAEEQRARDADTALQWECMNRFKNVELYEDYQEKQREKKARKISEYREEILRLWKEWSDREARELAEQRYFYGELAEKKLRDADNKLLTHANLLLEEAREHDRPQHALHKAIDRYCRMYRLYPAPELPASLREHFQRYAPRDGSAPDPPAPPAPAAAPNAPAAPAPSDRNGLQDPGMTSLPSSSKAADNLKREEHVDDYKRMNRANGLQRKLAEMDLSLPPLAVVPCKTEGCACALNK